MTQRFDNDRMSSNTGQDSNLSFAYKRAQAVREMRTRIFGTRVSLDNPLLFWALFNSLLFSMLNNWYGLLVFATVVNFQKASVYLLWANIDVVRKS